MEKEKAISSVEFFYQKNSRLAANWEKKISRWIKQKKIPVKTLKQKAQAVVVLGGDGTILHAAKKFKNEKTIIAGFNLGRLGFLASVREQKNFFAALERLFKGNYGIIERNLVEAAVIRKNRRIFKAEALNEVAVINPLGMVEIEADIEGFVFQNIRGTGVLAATSTGSTAFNLSAHGPIVLPDLETFILTEISDHNIPTPSLIFGKKHSVLLKIKDFRERNLLKLAASKTAVEVMLVADGQEILPLKKGDRIAIRSSVRRVKFAELEKNYFLKSLREKFAFR